MSNFGLPEYDQHREWIRNARNRNMKWEEIDYAGRGNDEGLRIIRIPNPTVLIEFLERS